MTPVSIDSLLQKANQHLQQKRLAEAESAFEQAILADPRCSAAYLGRGLVHMAKGDWGDAS
ncbi:MAG TPA: tetratricopeptide repeat protein, partial [Gemmataceae bacterium]|nr:tetratricopeptide repeat protein [Gemmataceae bacterium]